MAKKAFSSILTKDAPTAAAPDAAPLVKANKKGAGRPSKSPRGENLVPFHIDDDLLGPLDAEVVKRNYEAGRSSSSRREVINEALRLLLAIPKPAAA